MGWLGPERRLGGRLDLVQLDHQALAHRRLVAVGLGVGDDGLGRVPLVDRGVTVLLGPLDPLVGIVDDALGIGDGLTGLDDDLELPAGVVLEAAIQGSLGRLGPPGRLRAVHLAQLLPGDLGDLVGAVGVGRAECPRGRVLLAEQVGDDLVERLAGGDAGLDVLEELADLVQRLLLDGVGRRRGREVLDEDDDVILGVVDDLLAGVAAGLAAGVGAHGWVPPGRGWLFDV